MFLKSLDIFGFKSFADKTHIEFADGITALLGPNGCGKSNVVDAMKWALAENRAKNLRADTMESVIFNGTESRPALNIAEVTLTLSNENGLLPLDAPEIAIKRRLYRSGENEYFINNKQAGATEVRRLFMDTGVGKAAYSVMEQGKIDQILSTKPEDRRYLFEEAAGISRSKAEVAEAERELERTRQNLEKIEAALGESRRTYETLKSQSEKTLRFRALREEIFSREVDIQLLRMRTLLSRKANGDRLKAEAVARRDEAQRDIDSLLGTLTESSDLVRSLQTRMGELQQEVVRIQAEKAGKTAMAKKLSMDAAQAREKVAQLELHKSAVEERIESLNEEIDGEDADLHEKSRRLTDVRTNIESFRGNIAAAEERVVGNEAATREGERTVAEKEAEVAGLQEQLKAITEDIVQDLDARLRDSGFSAQAAARAREALGGAIGKIRVTAEGRLALFRDWEPLEHSAADAGRFVSEAIESLDAIADLAAQAEKAAEDYSRAVPGFIDEFLSPGGIITRKRGIDSAIGERTELIRGIRRANEERAAENASLAGKIGGYKETLSTLLVSEAKMAEQISASQKQADLLRRQLAQERAALAQSEGELYGEERRREELTEQLEEVQESLSEIEARGAKCVDDMNSLDAQIREYNASMSGKQDELRKRQAEQRSLQARYEQLTLDLMQAENDIRNIRQNFIDTHSRDLSEFEPRMGEITAGEAELREGLSAAREEFKSLGQVNLMAPEEFGEAKERYEKLKASFDDTKRSMDDLIRVSEEIRAKSTEMFLSTYNKIRRNFHNMFRRLFGGGRGELKLSTPGSVLTSGIDIYAQPPGKKLENIALLSGGEKTMTAVALLFATYQVRPSPFCLLDEIDAALDDKNVTSFVTALRSFAELSQYIVITHNKKTVLGARTMLGVTMEESGVSKVITMRLDGEIEPDDDADDKGMEGPADSAPFEEEDVPPEEGVAEVPRPPARIRNADGTVTDPLIVARRREEREAARRAREAAEAERQEGGGADGNMAKGEN